MKKGKSGYSLIEVLAALAIISIAILPIMSMYPAIFKQNKSASEMEEASRVALTIVDYIKARGYTNLNAAPKLELSTTNGFSKVYGLEGATGDINGGSFQIKKNELDTDLGFTSGVIFLNSKGLNFRNDEVQIAVTMTRTNVNLTNEDFYRDPASAATTTTAIMYGVTTPRFITGRVVIGWGKVNNVVASGTQQEKDRTLVKREKAYGVDFIVTPRLEE